MNEWLAILPILHFAVLYLVSRQRNTLKLMLDLWALTILDWFFVPLNYFFFDAIFFSWSVFLLMLLIAVFGTILIHYMWQPTTDGRKEYFFNRKRGLSPEGAIHFVFMVLQGSIILTALVSRPASLNFVYAMLSLLAYLVGYFVIIKYIRKRSHIRPEMPFISIGIIIVLARILGYFLR